MSDTRPAPFRLARHDLGKLRDGASVQLEPMTSAYAAALGPQLAAIDPWARVGYDGEAMIRFLAAEEAGVVRYAILVDEALAGTLVIRLPWLHGPYLNLIGLQRAVHGRGIGSAVLLWMESEARGRYRNLWLCVSAFNSEARKLYEREGYELAGRLDGLVFDSLDELLMRKKLFG